MLEHIDRHLDRSVELAELAAVAHFSPFHFHRLFTAWMGETLGDYQRRRRLEMAALRLVAQPASPVLDIALSVGFGSAEAFARAFKARYGCTATAWRQGEADRRLPARDRNPGQANRKPGQAAAGFWIDDGSLSTKEVPMQVRLIDRAPARIVYWRRVGPYGDGVSAFWQQAVAPWLATHSLFGQPRYGISHDDPGITAPAACRYDAAVELPPGFAVAPGLLTTEIPGGRYASMSFRGTPAQIGAAWAELLRGWLPQSGLQLDARPCFEYYPSGAAYDAQTGSFDCDIVVPVQPL